MAEQLAVEVDVKNVTEDGTVHTDKLLYLVRIAFSVVRLIYVSIYLPLSLARLVYLWKLHLK